MLLPLMSLSMDTLWGREVKERWKAKINIHAGFDVVKNVFFCFIVINAFTWQKIKPL